jgi:DNA-binding beta-propeller fold protein YncE
MDSLRAVLLLLMLGWDGWAGAQPTDPLRLAGTVPLPNVEGRIDHFSVDVKGGRLFMSALGNNTVEVIDLRTGTRSHTISGLNEPQGVLYVPQLNRIFVANGQGGACKVFDGTSLSLLHTIDFGDDADNLRYDPAAKLVYVGYGTGALGIINPVTDTRMSDIRLEGHPESFQLEPSGTSIFVNVPSARHIAVVDRVTRQVLARWTLPRARDNFPMALDLADHRLFVATRTPARVFVLNSDSGKVIADLESTGDADDIFYDSSRRRIYVSGGEGFVSVIGQDDADHYHVVTRIPTASGARTSFFVPEFGRLYLAVPRRKLQSAAIRIYQARP